MKSYQITSGIGFESNGDDIAPTDAERTISALMSDACSRFGGVTTSRGIGSWLDHDGLRVDESVVIFTIWADSLDQVRLFAIHVRIRLNQDTVGLILPTGDVQTIAVGDDSYIAPVTPVAIT